MSLHELHTQLQLTEINKHYKSIVERLDSIDNHMGEHGAALATLLHPELNAPRT